MKYAMPAILAISIAALAGCERDASTASTTVVKEPDVVEKRETVVQRDATPAPASSSSTTIVEPREPAPSSSTNVTIDATKPAESSRSTTNLTIDADKPSTETSRSESTARIDTPAGSATKTETESNKTGK